MPRSIILVLLIFCSTMTFATDLGLESSSCASDLAASGEDGLVRNFLASTSVDDFIKNDPLLLEKSPPPEGSAVIRTTWFLIRNYFLIWKIRELSPHDALTLQGLDPREPKDLAKFAQLLQISENRARSYWESGLKIKDLLLSSTQEIFLRRVRDQILSHAKADGHVIELNSMEDYKSWTARQPESLTYFAGPRCYSCLVSASYFVRLAELRAIPVAYTSSLEIRNAVFVSDSPQIIYRSAHNEIRVNAAVTSAEEMNKILEKIERLKNVVHGLNILKLSKDGVLFPKTITLDKINQELFPF